jgi:hypothetical protein
MLFLSILSLQSSFLLNNELPHPLFSSMLYLLLFKHILLNGSFLLLKSTDLWIEVSFRFVRPAPFGFYFYTGNLVCNLCKSYFFRYVYPICYVL